LELNIIQTCKKRDIGGVCETPLIVPSFSSTIGLDVREIFSKVKEQLTMASLVSAYDLAKDKIDMDDIWYSQNVFIDSGPYENRILNNGDPKKWSLQKYQDLLDSMRPLTNVILVNYDTVEKFKTQISSAKDFFKKNQIGGKDFLFKRSSEGDSTVNVNDLTSNIQETREFDVIGLTEKEMGRSMLGRCKTIVKIRTSLSEAGLDLPIHVFGCVDPLSILAYFLCGADVFDGLVWLKHGFQDNLALYPSNFGLLSKQWGEYDESLSSSMYLSNLTKLTQLTILMRRIAQNWELGRLKDLLSTAQFAELRNLTDSADVRMDVN
jgi:hypothetical protein